MRRNCIVLIPTISIFLQSAHDHHNSQSLHEWFNALYLCFCLGCKYFLGFAYTLYPSLPAPPWLPPMAFLVWKCLSSFPSLNPFFFSLFCLLPPFPSFSLLWKVLQFGVSVPVVSMPTGCQGSGLVRSRAGLGCGGERERERESPSQASQTCFCPLEQQDNTLRPS